MHRKEYEELQRIRTAIDCLPKFYRSLDYIDREGYILNIKNRIALNINSGANRDFLISRLERKLEKLNGEE